MKQFIVVLKFELMQLIRKKSFYISILIVALLAFAGFYLPVSQLFQNDASTSENKDDAGAIAIVNEAAMDMQEDTLRQVFAGYEIQFKESKEEIEDALKQGSIDAGFVITANDAYAYYVENASLDDPIERSFQAYMQQNYQMQAYQEAGYDAQKIMEIQQHEIQADKIILGTDALTNYFYTYALIFLLYMMILMYGNQIAVNVVSEKSNRAIEVLVTSSSSNALMFGKVFAGAIAGILQTGAFILSAWGAYQLNADAWKHSLDTFLNIPSLVLITFSAFGIFGYLLFSFIYAAFGAMCSKTEEVNAATIPVQMIIVVCFFLSFITLQQPDSVLSTIVGYVPFTSWMAMFIKVAMGSATILEIMISFGLLVASVFLMGWISSKLYRQGTLHYGNSFQWKQVWKYLKR